MFGCIYLDSNVGPGENVDRGPLHNFFFPLPHRCLFGGWGRVQNYRGFSLEEILEQQKKKSVCTSLPYSTGGFYFERLQRFRVSPRSPRRVLR